MQWEDGSEDRLDFDAGQFHDGHIIVLGRYSDVDVDLSKIFGGGGPERRPLAFWGTTDAGATLRSVGHISTINYLPDMDGPSTYDAFRVNALEWVGDATVPATLEHRFGLVNFHFHGSANGWFRRRWNYRAG